MAQPTPSGRWVETPTTGSVVHAFVPNPLPPTPPLAFSHDDLGLLERANRSLGRLDGLSNVLPDTSLFVYMYVRREAVLSSQIEGTQSSLSDLLEHEVDASVAVPSSDVSEVSNYVRALQHGLKRIRKDDFPLSLRLIREVHEVLLRGVRGSDKTPGEFRRHQNWIGGPTPEQAIFVPPPRDHLDECLAAFERFLHDDTTPLLLRVALAHAQFETIHPFLDGNGRVGRLLIALLLCSGDALSEPLLYLSLYFKEHRAAYYDHLQRVRLESAWLPWVRFFLEGVRQTSDQAVATARELRTLFAGHKSTIEKQLGRKAGNGLRLYDTFTQHPVLTGVEAAERARLSQPTVNGLIDTFRQLGILVEVTGRKRDRLYFYRDMIDVLERGLTPARRGDHPGGEPGS